MGQVPWWAFRMPQEAKHTYDVEILIEKADIKQVTI